MSRRRSEQVVLGSIAAFTLWATPVWSQRAVITGRVTDAESNAGVVAAQVRVPGTTFGTLTHTDGTFRLVGVPAGAVTLQALRLGYLELTKTITVPDSGTVTVEFALSASKVQLDQVVITAAGTSERKREEGMSVATLTADSIAPSAVANFSDELSSREAGVSVQMQSGTTGGGSRIRIRGSNSASLGNQPLLVIDGVRVDNAESDFSTSVGVGGQAPSRFDDLDPQEIEDITILKGPAASALYGSAGANGVIQVTTKHGKAGHTQWDVHGEYGSVRNYTEMPANYGRNGTNTADGSATSFCTLVLEATDQCTPTGADGGLISFNPLTTYSPFIAGYRQGYGGSVSGGSDLASFFGSGDYYKEQGVYPNNTVERANVRANVHTTLSPKFDGTVNVGYLASVLGLPQNDNASFGVLSGGLLGQAFNDSLTHGFSSGVTPAKLATYNTQQSTDRFTVGATGNWHPLSWFSWINTAGLDYSTIFDLVDLPPNVFPSGSQLGAGEAQDNPFKHYTWTVTSTASAQYPIDPSLKGTSSLGMQFVESVTNGVQANCLTQVPGTSTLAGCTTNLSLPFALQPTDVQEGGFAQQQIQWRDKVFLTGALRGDEVSSEGVNVGIQWYPSVSLSWVMGEEPFFPKTDILSSLRLRAAFGESGQFPTFGQDRSSEAARATKKLGSDQASVFDSTFGNPNLTPERTREFEGGFDAGFWRDKINVEFTVYNKRTSQALVQRTLAPSTGASEQFVNLGLVQNEGLELGINATLIDTKPFRADVTANASVNHNKLLQLGQGIAPITFDAGNASDTQGFYQGYSLGGFWSYPYTYKDLHHNGIITPDDLTVGSNLVFFGNSQPSDEYTISPEIVIFKFLKISSVFDRHAGVLTYDGTEEFRCGFSIQVCPELYLKSTPLKWQAAAVASANGLSDAGWYEDGSFWKWRELTITVSAPSDWAHRIGAADLSFSLSGRNLAVWTNYKGFDPEINFGYNGGNTSENNFTSSDFLTQPPVRYWTGRVNITW
jgi:TonB-linked SusC/RagA family outer membrane protein